MLRNSIESEHSSVVFVGDTEKKSMNSGIRNPDNSNSHNFEKEFLDFPENSRNNPSTDYCLHPFHPTESTMVFHSSITSPLCHSKKSKSRRSMSWKSSRNWRRTTKSTVNTSFLMIFLRKTHSTSQKIKK